MNRPTEELFPWELPEGEDGRGAAVAKPAAQPGPAAFAPTQPAPGLEADRGERRDDRAIHDRAEMVLAGPTRPIAQKEYYSISEVCEIVGLKPHVLRYWETQFGPLNPSKNRSGNRVYQRKEIKLILLVKHLLYEEKYTVEGARAKLDQLRRTGRLTEVTGRVLDIETARMIRSELEELARVLGAPDGRS